MPNKHVDKSLVCINKKAFFDIKFFRITTQTKKKQPFSIPTLVAELISILVDARMYFNYGFDFIFFTLVHNTIMNS